MTKKLVGPLKKIALTDPNVIKALVEKGATVVPLFDSPPVLDPSQTKKVK